MLHIVYIFFLVLQLSAHAAPKEFVIETKLDSATRRPAAYSMRVIEGENSTISSSDETHEKTAMTVIAEDLGEGHDGNDRVMLKFQIEVSNHGQTLRSTPRIVARIGEPASIIIAEKGHETLRLQVKALRR